MAAAQHQYIEVRVPVRMLRDLDLACQQQGRSRSDLLQELICMWLGEWFEGHQDGPAPAASRQPTVMPPSSRQRGERKTRDEVRAEVEAFLAQGGEIKEVAREPAPISRPANPAYPDGV